MDSQADSNKSIVAAGTVVVTRTILCGESGKVLHPAGAVGVVVKAPVDLTHSYRVRFPDGLEVSVKHDQIVILSKHHEHLLTTGPSADRSDLLRYVIYRCVMGSRAYGLDSEGSDVDYRGIYLPPANRHWSLCGVPEQLENEATQEVYWELQKVIVFALKANPNVLESLYSPTVELSTPLADQLLSIRECFLSKLIYQTFNGYVLSQFKKLQADLRNRGAIKWKHAMHLIRLLIAGIRSLEEGIVPVHVGEHREKLLAIKRGEMPWEEIDGWRRSLHEQFDKALSRTSLPDRPDYAAADRFLIEARRHALTIVS